MKKNEMILNSKGEVARKETYKAVRGYVVSIFSKYERTAFGIKLDSLS